MICSSGTPAYDNANRRQTLTLPNGIVLTYGYDNDSRINSMSYQLSSLSVGTLIYQYDAAGRRTQMGGSLAATGFPSAMSSAVYDVANELTNWNGTTITPDANGNILNDGVAAYTWNARNQLITKGSTNFEYDAYGRRILNAAGNNLLYEGWNAAQQISGTTVVENRILGGIDEFFSRTDSTGTYAPITDGLGSVLALTNSSGGITTQYGYDPYGNTTSSGALSTNVFQYTGRENDGNGLYFYRGRYYSPGFGRFISEDAIYPLTGTNGYAYAMDDPTFFTDPFGFCATPLDRTALAARGITSLASGLARTGLAIAGIAGAPESGGLSLALTVYNGVSGLGSTVAGVADLYGAISGDTEGAEGVATAAETGTTVSGGLTLALGGSMQTASAAASVEGMFMIGFGGGVNAAEPEFQPLMNAGEQSEVVNVLDNTDSVASPLDNAIGIGGAVLPSMAGKGCPCP